MTCIKKKDAPKEQKKKKSAMLSGYRIPDYPEIATGSADKEFMNKTMNDLFNSGVNTVHISSRTIDPLHHITLMHPRGYQLDLDIASPQMPVFVESKVVTNKDTTVVPIYSTMYLNRRMASIWNEVRNEKFFTDNSESTILGQYMFGGNATNTKNFINSFCKRKGIRVTELFMAFPMLFKSAFEFLGVTVSSSIGDVDKRTVVSVKGSALVRSFWKKAINGDKLFFVVKPLSGDMKTSPPQIQATACVFPSRKDLVYKDLNGQEQIAPVFFVGVKKNDDQLPRVPVHERTQFYPCNQLTVDIRTVSISIGSPWYDALDLKTSDF